MTDEELQAFAEQAGDMLAALMADAASGPPTVVDVSCAICAKPVGYRELYPPGVGRPASRGGDDPQRLLDRAWEYVDDGDRSGNGELTADQYAHAVEALTGPRPQTFLKLYCPACGLAYCWDHWKTEYSDAPPVCMGQCSQGHWHVIDMG